GHAPGQILGQKGSGLAFGGRFVGGNAHGGMTNDGGTSEDAGGGAFGGGELDGQRDFIIADGENISGLKTEARALVISNHAVNNDIAVVLGSEAIGSVPLNPAAEGSGDWLAQARFSGFIAEEVHLDRAGASHLAV